MRKLNKEEALARAAAYCAASEHCTAEVESKLRAWGIGDDDAVDIVKRLKDEGYLSDSRFARFYARDKARFNAWGKRKIALMLRSKHIDEATVEQALGEVDADDYAEKLRQLLRAKAKSVKAKNEYERSAKLVRFALGRGFDMDLIRQCVGEVDDVD